MSHDPVNHPPQYTSSQAKCSHCGAQIECIDITKHMNFSTGNAMKYLWRHELKGKPIEDLQKAIWYLNAEIERRKKQEK